MIRIIGSCIRANSSQVGLRVAVLLGSLLTLAPRIQSQTPTCPMNVPHGCKPSDVFFFDPAHPDQRGAPYNIGTDFAPLNKKPQVSIVAKDVVLRGWLMDDPFHNALFADQCKGSQTPPSCDTMFLGWEDVLYNLVLDYDFINSTYGSNAGVLNGAVFPGNPVDSQTKPIPLADSGNGTLSGIGINSFWLPFATMSPLTIHLEVNSWHARGSQHCQAYNVPLAGNVGCDLYENYAGRSAAPAGWVEREFDYTGALPNNAADNWWAFDPDDPDGMFGTDVTGAAHPLNLKKGDYVEVRGTLWQDVAHDAGNFVQKLLAGTPLQSIAPAPLPYCEGQIYHNQDGYLEMHPVDSISRLGLPGPHSPLDQPLQSAQDGVKRVVAVMLCSDGTGAAGNGTTSSLYSVTVCPEGNYNHTIPGRTIQPGLMPHFVELVDGKFSTPQSVTRNVGVSGYPDCINILASSNGVPWARFKASYVVWWTPAPQGATGITVRVPNSGISQVQLTTQLPALTVTISSTGPASSPVTDTVTVTSNGAPVVGATVSSGNSTYVTNASGVVVITHSTCFAGTQVAKVGVTIAPARVPVPCSLPAMASKTGFQSASFNLP